MAARRLHRRLSLGLMFCFFAAACSSAERQTATAEAAPTDRTASADTAAMWQATVLVENGAGHGTGVIIGNGSILTAYHVVDEGLPVVEFFGGERRRGAIQWADPVLDLAILRVGVPVQYPAPPVFCGEVGSDQRLVAIGHPLTTRWVAVEGHLGAPHLIESNRLLALSFDLSLGNSGGPIFDNAGRVVGIASAILVTETVREIAAQSNNNGHHRETGLGLMLPANRFCDELRAA